MRLYRLTLDGSVLPINEIPENTYLTCAFGCFDGVHIGHLALLKAAVDTANALNKRCRNEKAVSNQTVAPNVLPAVWTFASPVSNPWIISVPERLALCGKNGIRYAICQEFDDVRELSPAEFIFSICDRCKITHAVCGYNFRFGKGRTGTPSTLETLVNAANLRYSPLTSTSSPCITVINEVSVFDKPVSSTRIRALIAQGNMEDVRALLGRHYSMLGTVISGNQIGRTLSRPTANLRYSPDQLIPHPGVYFTICSLNGHGYRAVTNIGYRPTVNTDPSDITCETHLLDFTDSLYGEQVRISFCHFARCEKAFPDLSELSAQINKDVADAVRYFHDNPTLTDTP